MKNKFKHPLICITFSALCLLPACQKASKEAKQERPNIIFIMSDDHASQAISAYGSTINKTPNIDRLAVEGMLFERSYVTNSICAPSRATMLTGKFNHLNGQIDNATRFDGSQQTFPKLLQSAGYRTALVGKWHLKSDPTGFDYWNVLPGQGDYYDPDFIEMGERKNIDGYVTDITTDIALNWLDTIQGDQPFCLLLHHKAPHRNWMPDTKHLSMFQNEELPYPETLFDDYRTREKTAAAQEMSIANHMYDVYDLKLNGSEEESPAWMKGYMEAQFKKMSEEELNAWNNAYGPENEAFEKANLTGRELIKWKYQRYIKDYLRCIASVDDNIGRVLDYLKQTGLDKNTIVVYTSDQGFYLGEHGWYDKRWMYEESLSMPLIIKYPGVTEAGSVNKDLVQNIDFAPTFLDLAGVEVPEDIQGRSLKPVLNQQTPDDWRDGVYYHYYEYPGIHAVKRHYGIRTDKYKLIHFYHDSNVWELYDLEKDLQELNNLYDSPAYSEIQQTLHQKLRQLQTEYKDDNYEEWMFPPVDTTEHLAIHKKVIFTKQPAPQYSKNWERALTDGLSTKYTRYWGNSLKEWLGFNKDPMEITVDLGKISELHNVGLHCLQNFDSWIYLPEQISISGSSDGKQFDHLTTIRPENNYNTNGDKLLLAGVNNAQARYIKITVENLSSIPQNHPGAGNRGWVFVDEIIIN
ncbi:sulfatase-like hydrolase/transferase [Fulvivirgaceae bacterium BMA10]|uniref:Sulfatase-like hydrolase/transferase n=1 Tax=Splendidivirga corallicola TaxID=3051826 RepID=A0ABT8KQM4_9BACT|nr:sulfatase-like hydrolase/transferase [Fulvivirgaceae bacterium BMA10]